MLDVMNETLTRDEATDRAMIREAIRHGGAVYADANGVLRVTSAR